MSALNFQRAMAHLIRFPNDPLEKWETAYHFELTEQEKRQLRMMAGDPLVKKFGYKMRFLRCRDAFKVMRLSNDFIDEKLRDDLYLNHFEVSQTEIDLERLGIQFVEYCLGSEAAPFFRGTAPFLQEMLRYDLARALTERRSPTESVSDLPEGSLLTHTAFTILDLNYDLPSFEKLLMTKKEYEISPLKKETKVIFLSVDEHPYYRVFKIDSEVEQFLNSQRQDPSSYFYGPDRKLPAAYPAMVKVGLCRIES